MNEQFVRDCLLKLPEEIKADTEVQEHIAQFEAWNKLAQGQPVNPFEGKAREYDYFMWGYRFLYFSMYKDLIPKIMQDYEESLNYVIHIDRDWET